jgi:hypothetical protein
VPVAVGPADAATSRTRPSGVSERASAGLPAHHSDRYRAVVEIGGRDRDDGCRPERPAARVMSSNAVAVAAQKPAPRLNQNKEIAVVIDGEGR